MPRKTSHAACPLDLDTLRSDLTCGDAAVRARAVRALCPCRLGWDVFEEYLRLVRGMCRDPSPLVRGAAKHVLEDAFEMASSGLPTSNQETRNEMAATRRRSRWRKDDG